MTKLNPQHHHHPQYPSVHSFIGHYNIHTNDKKYGCDASTSVPLEWYYYSVYMNHISFFGSILFWLFLPRPHLSREQKNLPTPAIFIKKTGHHLAILKILFFIILNYIPHPFFIEIRSESLNLFLSDTVINNPSTFLFAVYQFSAVGILESHVYVNLILFRFYHWPLTSMIANKYQLFASVPPNIVYPQI